MFAKIVKIIYLLSHKRLLKQLLLMPFRGYLKEIGWIESFNHQLPINQKQEPLPWVTYGFIDFIASRLKKSMDIFEYGSGNSTLWYASKVNSVIAVEHSKEWFETIKEKMPNNVEIYFQELQYGGEYSIFSNQVNKKFDIIIIDGRDRVNSLKNSINNLKNGGVIILDDSEREAYREGISFLLNNNFRKIDFWGISPGLFYKKNTTIFYRENNCLGI